MTDVTMADAAEHKLIIDWIAGRFRDGSIEDLAARRAIARRLRHGPLSVELLAGLATLIDPDFREVHGWWLAAKRPRGRPKSVDDRRVAATVWQELKRGQRMKVAVAEAMGKFGITSPGKVYEAFRKWKPHFENSDPS